jgi:phospholipid/cholesterol/gamma-HCH transport system substrate-binding protein
VSNLQRSRIQDIIANFSVLSENLKNKSGAMGSIIDNLANITDSLKQANIKSTLLSINAVMLKTEKIMEKIERGEGSLGLLVNDEQLYNDLTHAVKDLDYLLMDVRTNPKRFVRFSVFSGGNKKKEINRDTAEIKKLSDPLIQTLIRKEFKHKLDSIRKN